MRAELGSLADAEAALRAAERALQDALARGADAMELSALMDAYEQAVSRYMQLLAREAAEAGRVAEGGAGGLGGMNANQLQALIDALREAAELGDTEGSRQALAQLQALLENMQLTLSQGGGGGESEQNPIAEALREALEELGDTIGEQRSVMEDTFNQQNAGQPGQGENGQGREPGEDQGQSGGEPAESAEGRSPGQTQDGEDGAMGAPTGEPRGGAGGGEPDTEGEGAGLAERQQALAEGLQGLAGALPEGEDGDGARAAIDEAREAMEAARDALERGDGEAAMAAQDDALAALRDAAGDASRRYESVTAGRGGEASDPLGRAANRGGAGGPGSETALPGEADRQRAREILEELRRRAAERGRPQEELDYIDRLLERF